VLEEELLGGERLAGSPIWSKGLEWMDRSTLSLSDKTADSVLLAAM
jgi:hypothetical protein